MIKKILGGCIALLLTTSFAEGSDVTKASLNTPKKVKYFKLNVQDERTIVLKGPVERKNKEALSREIKDLSILSNDPIFMIINSPGGSIADGLELINVMQSIKAKVYCAIETEAYSMAAIIALFCHKTFIHKYAGMMFHEASFGMQGTSSIVFQRINFIRKYLEMVDANIAEQMGVTLKEYLHLSKPEWWLTATEAAKYGIVDGVLRELLYTAEPPKVNSPIFFFGNENTDGSIVKNPVRSRSTDNDQVDKE